MAQGQGRLNSSTKSPKGNLSDGNRKLDAFSKRQTLAQHRKSLPIASVDKRLVEEVQKHDTLIIVGETGSGKTTQLPQFLYNAGFCGDGKLIGITQPRRVAAVTVAKRVAEECGVNLGEKVGYSIRFEDMTSSSTRIKYMTDGLLLREALLDPHLSRYSVIIVDEAHERTVHTDVLLGLLKSVQDARSKSLNNLQNTKNKKTNNDIQLKENGAQGLNFLKQYQGRTPLKLIIMSASLDARIFSEYFSGARAVHIQGRQFPVDIFYTLHVENDYLDASLATIFQVILATNIAETSVTISGIKYVIDPGLVKARYYDPNKGLESLVVVPISKAQALQRSGRAGREGPGKCFRLYQEDQFGKFEDSTKPEIKRCNLSNIILQLKALGVDDISGFDFIEKPTRSAIVKSLEQLFLLGALTDDCKLSNPVGRQMACLPLDPIYSKALILASEFNCLEEMLITVAMLSVESIFYSPRDKKEESRTTKKSFASPEGDHLTLVNVYRASNEFLEKRSGLSKEKREKAFRKWCKENFIDSRSLRHARDIHSQIRRNVEQMGLRVASCGDDVLQFCRCLAASFFLNAALKQPEGSYRALANGEIVSIHPSSVFFKNKPECLIFNELVETNRKYIRNTTKIDYLWLTELAPQFYAVQN
ncbi:hypothetical protein PRUPE_1G288500 [Prunus persica]|uniref:RNA helicase n=1 Tax=Prunus persica TaxID=3760 RepID=A0A251R4R6_PRUPE|nr:hypothetical protein PRUPE_1G288500 [Prunus persica]ONI31040.1 hypothetical protein PRUPE_1G288500 [Prunus persica]